MFVCLQLVFLMLIPTAVSTPPAGDQDCKSGWFGENCMYQCHCADSVPCASNGDCPQGEGCAYGYFGPGCQYVNVVSAYVSYATAPYLRDQSYSSCNPKVNATSVEVILIKEFPFSWFRIFFKHEVPRLKKMKVRLNGTLKCHNKRIYRVSSTALDVSCDTNIPVMKLRITGSIARVVCTISISGEFRYHNKLSYLNGRNVAVKQEASQSSNLPNDIYNGVPSRAVDGNISNDYETSQSCSSTGIEKDGAEWHLRFNRPQILFRILVYNQRGAIYKRLQGFSLKTFAEDGTETNYFKDTSESLSLVYEINLLSRVPVTSLMVKGGTILPLPDRVLTICEVETYGETVCPSDTYGIYCNQNCQCSFGGVCSVINGVCVEGCSTGTYGFNCSFVCSEKCLYRECSERDGGCIQCVPGYTGRFCNKKCQPGTFGLLCQGQCSKYCDRTCDFITGHCNCTEHHAGEFCTECPVEKYGDNCSLSCPPTCQEKSCDIENGTCLSCVGAYIGPTCEDCPENFYGKDCYSQCSEYCLNRTCHYKSGKCYKCVGGFSGDMCNESPESETWLVVPIPIFFVVCCLCLCQLFYKIKPVKSDESDG